MVYLPSIASKQGGILNILLGSFASFSNQIAQFTRFFNLHCIFSNEISLFLIVF